MKSRHITHEELSSSWNTALEFVSLAETPRSLKDLSRHTIARLISRQSIFSSPDLGLPKVLQKYVLLDYYSLGWLNRYMFRIFMRA